MLATASNDHRLVTSHAKWHTDIRCFTIDSRSRRDTGRAVCYCFDAGPPAIVPSRHWAYILFASPMTALAPLNSSRAFEYHAGDVLLRSGSAGDSIAIMTLTGGPYSHAGIYSHVERNEVIDAYPPGDEPSPRRTVDAQDLNAFFSEHPPQRAAVYRYNHPGQKGEEAAQYAIEQLDEHYVFDIIDPIVGIADELLDNHRLYCSEFVWRCYRFGANINLIEINDFINILSDENLEEHGNHFAVLIRERHQALQILPDGLTIKGMQVFTSLIGHNGRFISPSQLANSPHLDQVREFGGEEEVKP